MFDRISASFALARSSWQVLRLDKQLLLFPILSGLGCLLVLGSFAIPFLAHPQWLDFLNNRAQGMQQTPSWVYVYPPPVDVLSTNCNDPFFTIINRSSSRSTSIALPAFVRG